MSRRPSNIYFSHPVSGSGGWQVIPELSDEELGAIGLLTVQWANLEHAIYEASLYLSGELSITPSPDFEDISFDKRLRAFRLLAKGLSAPESLRHTTLCDHIANIKDDRHKITHGLWDWDRSVPGKLVAMSFRPKYGFEKPYDLVKLNKLTDRLGELIFQVMFPGGMQPGMIGGADVRPLGSTLPVAELKGLQNNEN